MAGQTLVTKVLGVVGTIVLAWYLSNKDFGLVGLALAVAAFPSLIRDAGMQQILVHRHTHFRRWAGPVFWMSLVLGIVAGLVLAVIAPVAAHVLNAPGLTGLILLLALLSPINALATVSASSVQADLRYRFQSILALVMAVAMMALNIVFARLRFGAYSYVLPYVLVNAGRTVALWIAAPPPIDLKLRLRRWKYIIGDSGILLMVGALAMLVSQGDYLLLGYFRDADTVGIFFFAFNLSMQTLALLTVNLGSVLFPALSKLKAEEDRQTDAFIRAARVFAALSIPFCLLQAAGSDAGMRLLFNPLRYPAIPVLQVLSIAMAFRAASIPAQALAAAQNRIRFSLVMTLCNAVVFLSVVALAAKFGGTHPAITVAVAEMCFFAVSDPAYMVVLLRMNRRSFGEVASVYIAPLAGGAVAAFCAAGAGWLFPSGTGRTAQAIRLCTISLVMGAVYVPLLYLMAPKLARELWERVRSVF